MTSALSVRCWVSCPSSFTQSINWEFVCCSAKFFSPRAFKKKQTDGSSVGKAKCFSISTTIIMPCLFGLVEFICGFKWFMWHFVYFEFISCICDIHLYKWGGGREVEKNIKTHRFEEIIVQFTNTIRIHRNSLENHVKWKLAFHFLKLWWKSSNFPQVWTYGRLNRHLFGSQSWEEHHNRSRFSSDFRPCGWTKGRVGV